MWKDFKEWRLVHNYDAGSVSACHECHGRKYIFFNIVMQIQFMMSNFGQSDLLKLTNASEVILEVNLSQIQHHHPDAQDATLAPVS